MVMMIPDISFVVIVIRNITMLYYLLELEVKTNKKDISKLINSSFLSLIQLINHVTITLNLYKSLPVLKETSLKIDTLIQYIEGYRYSI